jgi:hypothetical protein
MLTFYKVADIMSLVMNSKSVVKQFNVGEVWYSDVNGKIVKN